MTISYNQSLIQITAECQLMSDDKLIRYYRQCGQNGNHQNQAALVLIGRAVNVLKGQGETGEILSASEAIEFLIGE